MTPFTPVVGVVSTVLLVGASVAKCAAPIKGAGIPLQLACCALHLFGGGNLWNDGMARMARMDKT